MNNDVKYFIEQHSDSVAQVFSMYNIDKKPNVKVLAAAIVAHKGLSQDLENLVKQKQLSKLDGFDVIQSFDGEFYRGRRKHRRRLKRQLAGSTFYPALESGNNVEVYNEPLFQKQGRVMYQAANVPQQPSMIFSQPEFNQLPELLPTEDEEGFDGIDGENYEGDQFDHARGKKKEFTYKTGTGDFDVTKSRRNAKDTIGIVKAGIDAAAGAANAGLDIAAKAKGLKDGGGAAADGTPAPDGSSDKPGFNWKKYAPYIAGGVVLVVVVVAGIFSFKKKGK